ncbi:hypothetical protein NSA56_12935 [Oceanobacillus caeni]|uniref:hypothetical protein n=1 Tax=Bacillaceae TaxID=186817 RepID=UPI00069AB50C|nr:MULTISPECIES: hypothetical protein [Bacillaceae]PZD85945.1 hypothetical protein DEJ64_08685 [Bacilli bacterium]MBU8790486.1 hypothetical protein [Oceanobacillus caeni]MCR1835302.1 hypothetical protein [Oceanobacillus caeni]MED4475055.1 hypothetical protein [Oceanobacillus caeni]PZD87406.1 hypothetical protein DEJ60_08930 [Bacilli bacterium]
MKGKIRLLRSLEVVGILLLLLGFSLGFIGVEFLKVAFIRPDLVPITVGFLGVLLFLVASSAIGYEKNKTREQQIEEKDERVIHIYENSKSKAFDLMTTIIPLGLLTFVMLGYMNKVSFFFLAGLYLICICYYYYHLLLNKKKM